MADMLLLAAHTLIAIVQASDGNIAKSAVRRLKAVAVTPQKEHLAPKAPTHTHTQKIPALKPLQD